MSIPNKSKIRVDKLFAEMNQPVSEPSNGHGRMKSPPPPTQSDAATQEESANLLKEMEELRARIRELESSRNGSSDKPSAPILYEKEEVGFAFTGEEIIPVRDAGPQVEDEADAVKTPLTSGGKFIGEMKIAQPAGHTLNDEDIKMANAVAQQVSQQIENLRLLAAAERARHEAEEATHQFTHRNWENFLDAIHNSERIGYAYDQKAVESFIDPAPSHYDHAEIMQVLDQQIGRIFVKGNQALTDDDKTLINAIASQVSQQVENIRLLADASRARAEAEEATRRLTRQNWEAYQQNRDSAVGFVYSAHEVIPLEGAPMLRNTDFAQPLVVRGETIGQLAVSGGKIVSPEEADLAAAIAAQASIHLETLRLTEELQKRAQELRELDRLKSAFLANMSHELRTPLNSILGFTDVMLEGLDGELTEYMDNDLRLIQKNGQHLLHLINDVLDMAKIESGRMNLHPEKFKVHSILDEVVSITSTLASEKNLALFIEPDSDREIEIFADNTRLRQVMINLVNNSIKFTAIGRIAIKAAPMDSARLLITVKDTGIGIPHDKLDAIFQEFTQVDSSTTRKAGGTGLGLPISRRLVEMHGGRLWAESTGIEGEGATFLVELPLEARITEVVEKQE